MAHNLIKGIDRMAAASADTVWHRGETEQDGRLVETPPRYMPDGTPDHEGTLIEMASKVWPIDADNDVADTSPIYVDGRIIDSHVATRSPSGRVLGIDTKGYAIIKS